MCLLEKVYWLSWHTSFHFSLHTRCVYVYTYIYSLPSTHWDFQFSSLGRHKIVVCQIQNQWCTKSWNHGWVYKFDVMPYSLQIITPSTIINISHKANLILGMYWSSPNWTWEVGIMWLSTIHWKSLMPQLWMNHIQLTKIPMGVNPTLLLPAFPHLGN
jgi:hypothetical protein